jgi:hypothetical protein
MVNILKKKRVPAAGFLILKSGTGRWGFFPGFFRVPTGRRAELAKINKKLLGH